MDNIKNKIFDIREKTFNYALGAVKLFRNVHEEKSGVCRILGKQYIRAATSIGANIEEAQAAESKADFIHKFTSVQKEAKESLYWLQLIDQSSLVPKTV